MHKSSIYLAGPIAGCNADQLHVWRNELKAGFSDEFDFIDPTDGLVTDDRSDFEVVQADAEAIKRADAVLANMWRESIGTAMGVMHAHSAGKITVVCDPNLIRSRTLAFYADTVERSLPAALASIRTFLRAQGLIVGVRKTNGDEEVFHRQKLALSIRKACIAARQSDIVPARAIAAKSLGILLTGNDDQRILTTGQIKDAVWEAVAELAADPLHQTDYDAIRRAWEHYAAGKGDRKKPGQTARPTFVPEVHGRPLEVPISSHSHSTIWGNQVGAEALRIFEDIKKVDGIVEIRLTQFKNTGSPPAKPHVRIQASKTPNIIEGVCYDRGKKGTLQTFQIRLANPGQRDGILIVLRDHLVRQGHIRTAAYSAD